MTETKVDNRAVFQAIQDIMARIEHLNVEERMKVLEGVAVFSGTLEYVKAQQEAEEKAAKDEVVQILKTLTENRRKGQRQEETPTEPPPAPDGQQPS